MLAFLPNLISHSNDIIGTVLHIGAGVGSELEIYQNLNFENVVALEPDDSLFKKLSNKAKRTNNVKVFQTWIGEKNTEVEAQNFANPRFNSLLAAGSLLEHFSNLKESKVKKVKTLALNEFLSTKLALEKNKQNVLVIEVQGFEIKLLHSCDAPLLQNFSLVIVRTSNEVLYQDGANAKQLSTCLKEKSYDFLLSDTSHFPFVEHYYQLNKCQVAHEETLKGYAQLKQQNFEKVNQLSEQLAEQKQVLTIVQEHSVGLQQTLTGKEQELKAVNEKLQVADEEIMALKSSLNQADVSNTELKKQFSKEAGKTAEFEKQLDLKTKDLAEQAQKLLEIKLQKEEIQNKSDKLIGENSGQKIELEKLSTQVASLQNELTVVQQDKNSEIIKITKQRDAQTAMLQENLNQSEELKLGSEKKVKELIDTILGLQSSLLKAQDRITKLLELSSEESSKKTNEQISELHDSLSKRMDKSALNTIKQVESFIGLQEFLNNGSSALEYHGWPISSDIALFLVNKVQANNYDLIIEFGSGTSTVLFGKAVLNAFKQTNKVLNDKKQISNENQVISPSAFDLPKRVMTFEHNKKYADKTLSSINQQGLQDVIELIHAPLVDFQINDETYLYYSCEESLKGVAKLFQGRVAKILVLIDGPPASTGSFARLPAVHHLLNILGNHKLDLLLDDYIRDEEKQIAKKWKVMFEARSISYEEELIPCEKGAWFCKLNP